MSTLLTRSFICYRSNSTQLSQVSVESGYEVVRSLRFKVLRTIQTINIKIVDELLGTRNCEADERKRINKMVRVERLFARWYAFHTATSRPYNLTS